MGGQADGKEPLRDEQPQAGVSVLASRSMLPPGPRSRITKLPRLGIPPSAQREDSNNSTQPTAYTSVFASPAKPARAASAMTSPGAMTRNLAGSDTPSRLARFREKNWAKESKKRPRDESATNSSIQPPRPRPVPRLFEDTADDSSVVAASQESTATDSSSTRGDAATATVQPNKPAIPSVIGSDEDARAKLERETQIALCLHRDLVHDNARLKLKMDSLKEEIDHYYDLLVRIERVAADARQKTSEGTASSSDSAGTLRLAEGLQRIISAAKSPAKS